MEPVKTPFFWIKKIQNALVDMDMIPLFRAPKPCDWQALSSSLAKEFNIPDLSIKPSEMIWKPKEEFNEGFGENPIILQFTLSPLHGQISWILSQEDIEKITSSFLLTHPYSQSLSSEILQEGFYRYLVLNTLYLLEKNNLFPTLSPKMTETSLQEEEGALTLDVYITFQNKNTVGRLLLPSTFQKSWEKHFQQFPPTSLSDLSHSIEIPLSLVGGFSKLSYQELQKVRIGDFIILDQKKYDPNTEKGIVTLQLGNISLFHAKIKQNRIKLLDFAFYYEENTMTEKIASNPSPIEEDEDITPVEKIPTVEEKSAAIQDIPIQLTVEMARIHITLEKLLQLQPGNFLELGISPQQGVNLTVNGKKIGRGELVYLGDTLGIRVLELG